ncbi:MAG: GNAT family N-acetyltransferase [Candidatus Sericytochromatia bacterium]|nr:GNAT family N-acetyltransferase [Candidatus Tanganyikabacteria bacterium]
MKLETPRLIIEPAAGAPPDQLLPVFNSNPEYIANEEQVPGKTSYTLDDAGRYLAEEIDREDSRCLVLRERTGSRIVGTACLLVPNPSDGLPWLGLLLVHGESQGHGIGAEALQAIEHALAGEGWERLRIGVLLANGRARRFWGREGFHVVKKTTDTEGRPCWVMEKPLAAPGPR